MNPQENERAERISNRMEEYHRVLASIYESIVDKEFNIAEKDIKFLLMELRYTLNSMADDDF